jgi:hypothetical protein
MKFLIKTYSMMAALFISINSFAWPFDGKLDLYACEDSLSANSCNSSCRRSGDVQLEFKIDMKQNIVFFTAYKGGLQGNSGSYDNCKIIDKQNWICKTDDEMGGTLEQKMINGVYTSSVVIFPRNRSKLYTSYSCAKAH